MNCSPNYHGEPRQDVGNRQCDNTCFHWKACLRELGLPEDYRLRIWGERNATKKEIKNGNAHVNIKYSANSYKSEKTYKIWRILND